MIDKPGQCVVIVEPLWLSWGFLSNNPLPLLADVHQVRKRLCKINSYNTSDLALSMLGSKLINKPLHKQLIRHNLMHKQWLSGVPYLRWLWSGQRQPYLWCRPPSHPASHRCRQSHQDRSPERGPSSDQWANATHTNTKHPITKCKREE